MNKQIVVIENEKEKCINVDLQGDPVLLAFTLANAMQFHDELATVVIAGLICWACRTGNFEGLIEQMKQGAATYPKDEIEKQ